MAKLIIICGLPGTGKTTLAKELSKKLHIVCFHKDTFKEKLFDLLDGKSEKDSIRIGMQAIKLFFTIIEEQLSRNIDIIVEAPFNFSADYPLIKKWKNKYKLDIFTVICLIDKKIRAKRIKNRKRHNAHKERDRKINLDDKFNYKDIPGKQIRLNTNKPTKKLVKEIISKL